MPQSLRGKFLIAGKRLRDPNFYKTVVLIVEHNSGGAMGLVVNRPSTVTVAHALSEHFNLPETDDLVFVGGPVEPSALFILHDSVQCDGGEPEVVPGLYVGSSAEVFESVVRTAASDAAEMRFRIFSGCAGWAPGQLESEMRRGDWYVQPAAAERMFDDDPYALWDRMLANVQESHRILPYTVKHPEWN